MKLMVGDNLLQIDGTDTMVVSRAGPCLDIDFASPGYNVVIEHCLFIGVNNPNQGRWGRFVQKIRASWRMLRFTWKAS